jgi:hypothetical protein
VEAQQKCHTLLPHWASLHAFFYPSFQAAHWRFEMQVGFVRILHKQHLFTGSLEN